MDDLYILLILLVDEIIWCQPVEDKGFEWFYRCPSNFGDITDAFVPDGFVWFIYLTVYQALIDIECWNSIFFVKLLKIMIRSSAFCFNYSFFYLVIIIIIYLHRWILFHTWRQDFLSHTDSFQTNLFNQ